MTVDLYKINNIYLYNICYIQFSCSWFLQHSFSFPTSLCLTFIWLFSKKKGVIRREQVDFFLFGFSLGNRAYAIYSWPVANSLPSLHANTLPTCKKAHCTHPHIVDLLWTSVNTAILGGLNLSAGLRGTEVADIGCEEMCGWLRRLVSLYVRVRWKSQWNSSQRVS